MAKPVRKYHVGQKSALDIVIAVVLGVMTLAAVFPFYQVVLLSFADMTSYARHPLYLLPYCFDLTGYKTIFEDPMFFTSLGVTVFITLVGTTLNMLLSVMGAYVLSRKYLVGRKLFLNLIIFTMLFNGGLIPTYLVVRDLKLVNTVWAMILPCGISTYYLIIMKNYFMSLPDSLLEAARLDGATNFQVFRKVHMPLSMPIIVYTALTSFTWPWSDYILPKLLLKTKNTWTVAVGLMSLGETEFSRFAAGSIFIAVPIVILYLFLAKYLINGMVSGAVKE